MNIWATENKEKLSHPLSDEGNVTLGITIYKFVAFLL